MEFSSIHAVYTQKKYHRVHTIIIVNPLSQNNNTAVGYNREKCTRIVLEYPAQLFAAEKVPTNRL